MKLLVALSLTAALSLVTLGAGPTAKKPNLLLMVADDLGYHDLGCYGASKIATPRIDSLAREGARFTDAHSFSGICMPSQHTNLAASQPERLKSMRERFAILTAGYKSGGANSGD